MAEIDSLILQFIKEIHAYYSANAAGDFQRANRHFRGADRIICEIKLIPDWTNMFLPLLNDEDPGVRLRVASILLPYETKQAEAVLRKLCFARGLYGFSARMVLNEWFSGKLKFPAFDNGRIVYQ